MSFDLCAKAVERADPDRFHAALLAPMPERAHLMALFAFNLEVARAPWVTREPMIAEMRLQWWRDAIEEIYSGQPPRKHEVVEPLAKAIGAHGLPREPFDAIIDARKRDIERPAMTPEAAFDYCDASSGSLMVLAVRMLSPGGEARDAARHAGQAQGVANFAVALPGLYAAGWRALDALDGAALEQGTPTEALAGAVGALGDLGRGALRQAREQRQNLPRAALPALVAAWRAPDVLREMIHPARRRRIFDRNFEVSEARRRFAILVRGTLGRW